MDKESIMDEIIQLILTSDEYLRYRDASKKLEEETDLLNRYQNVLQEYEEQKKYEKYIDISRIKNELKEVKGEVSQNQNMQEYYNSLNDLNELLEEVTKLIFANLLDDSLLQPYFK